MAQVTGDRKHFSGRASAAFVQIRNLLRMRLDAPLPGLANPRALELSVDGRANRVRQFRTACDIALAPAIARKLLDPSRPNK